MTSKACVRDLDLDLVMVKVCEILAHERKRR